MRVSERHIVRACENLPHGLLMRNGRSIWLEKACRREIGGGYGTNEGVSLPISLKELKLAGLQKRRRYGTGTASTLHGNKWKPCSRHGRKLHLLHKPIHRCSDGVRGEVCASFPEERWV